MDQTLYAVREAEPGDTWRALFARVEAGYRRWFLREGDAARPSYRRCLTALRTHMPELLPLYERLVELAGGGDTTARMLSLYRPSPYLTGCSQAAWIRNDPFLVRNYDYSPKLWDGVLLHSRWLGRAVVGMTDSLWGMLDGINDAGLTVSLAFGGRKVVGDGFGMPLILRYVLQMCDSVTQAREILTRVPTHMSYNVTVMDADGDHITAFLAPDRPPRITRLRIATNHQGSVEWPAYATATRTLDRERLLITHLDDPREFATRFVDRFLLPPLYSTTFAQGWGTLYTAVYHPRTRGVTFRWPNTALQFSIDRFEDKSVRVVYPTGSARDPV